MFNSTNHIDFYKTQQPFNTTIFDAALNKPKPTQTSLASVEDALTIVGSVVGVTVFILFMILAVWVFLSSQLTKVTRTGSPQDVEANAMQDLKEEGRRFREQQRAGGGL